MHSFIIYSSSKAERQKYLINQFSILLDENFKDKNSLDQISNPDIIIIKPEKSIKISQIRELKNSLSKKPYSHPSKIAVIPSADQLTLPAQHALLKTLEEPTPNTYIFLELTNPNLLLQTIKSRCQLIKIKGKSQPLTKDSFANAKSIIIKLSKASPGQRLKIIHIFKTREEAISLLTSILLALRKISIHYPNWYQALKLAQITRENLNNNNNLNLCLEHFALKFPKNLSIKKIQLRACK